MNSVDICVRNARLRRREALADIAIADGGIVALGPALDVTAREEIDAGGNLVTESYVNPHLHLCKVWTLPMTAEEALKSYRAAGMAHTASTPAGKTRRSRIGRPPQSHLVATSASCGKARPSL